MTSADNHADNIAFVTEMAERAAADGCQLMALPEVAGLMKVGIDPETDNVGPAESDPFLAACASLAARHGLWIHAGSTPVTSSVDSRLLNHSAMFDDLGTLVADYDKIHLFDVHLEGRKPILESSRYAPGDRAVLAQSPWGGLGLSICYDLRFPALYRRYAQAGAKVLFIPSAFTVPTGKAHWEVLLRARAIENGAFVVAAAQTGHHGDGRETYGHGLIVDPWGEVLADMGTVPGVTCVDLDLSKVDTARARIPSLTHDRPIGSFEK